jgi:hypothetical protein
MADLPALLVVSALLGQGRRLHELSLMLTLAGLVAAIVAGPTVPVIGLSVVLLVVACAEIWLAVRVGFDAALFRQLATGRIDLPNLDAGLNRAGLVPPTVVQRSLDSRISGAKRLLTQQAAVVVGQLAMVVALIVTAWSQR